ncbi:MAG TPA: DUF4386 domain-containing protein [Propionicimonas sp.]
MSHRLDPARTTGLLYLAVAITSAVGHLMLGGRLFAGDDPATWLDRISRQAPTARAAAALTLGIALSQALVSIAFLRLYRPVDGYAAGTLAAFGLVNAVTMLASAALLGAAVDTATSTAGATAASVQLLHMLDANVWDVAGLFFGLWLVPMGWLVLRSGSGPRALGWLLITGGGLYVIGAFVTTATPGATALTTVLALPATAGELWIITHLLVRGARSATPEQVAGAALRARVAGQTK